MRFLSGIIVGILLTVGSAYLFDSSRGGEEATGRVVNWDVVQAQLKISVGQYSGRLVPPHRPQGGVGRRVSGRAGKGVGQLIRSFRWDKRPRDRLAGYIP